MTAGAAPVTPGTPARPQPGPICMPDAACRAECGRGRLGQSWRRRTATRRPHSAADVDRPQ
eukprot:7925-Lingulodinium_polyedra.AAC.1